MTGLCFTRGVGLDEVFKLGYLRLRQLSELYTAPPHGDRCERDLAGSEVRNSVKKEVM